MKDGDWEERGHFSGDLRSDAASGQWEDTMDRIRAHPTWNDVINDVSLAHIVSSKMAWAAAVHAARPREAYALDVERPGFRWQKRVLAFLLETAADDRTVIWIVDPVGGLGKTKFALYLASNHDAMLSANDLRSDSSLYGGQRIFVLDLARQNGPDRVSYRSLEMAKDGVAIQTKYQVVTKIGRSAHVLVLANCEPDRSALSEDRWHILHSADLADDSKTLHDFFPPGRFPTGDVADPFAVPAPSSVSAPPSVPAPPSVSAPAGGSATPIVAQAGESAPPSVSAPAGGSATPTAVPVGEGLPKPAMSPKPEAAFSPLGARLLMARRRACSDSCLPSSSAGSPPQEVGDRPASQP